MTATLMLYVQTLRAHITAVVLMDSRILIMEEIVLVNFR